MNIEQLVLSSPESKREYEYYLSLGYGKKAAQLMTTLSYGDSLLSAFLRDFDEEARMDKLYDWLLERNEKTPMEAIRNAVMKKREKDRPFPEALRGLGMNLAQAFTGGAMTSAPGAAMMKASAPLEAGMAMCAAAPAPNMARACVVDEEYCEYDGEDSLEFLPELATDSYAHIEEKDALGVLTAPTSTFRMTTTTASMGILLNQIRNGRSVDMSQVRIEEVLNYFDFEHGAFEDASAKFRINTERFKKSNDKELFYVNVEASDQAKDHQNVILLLDVSGSMSSQAGVTLETLATIVAKLKENDVLSLVTYSSNDETVFENRVIAGVGDKEDVMGRILGIEINGCTYGSKGIETAYELGKKVYRQDWSNQVILITDGDLNFGITKLDGLQELIEEKKKGGMFLSVIGTGLYNYQDDKLEVLAKHGNGTYCVVNNLEDVDYSVNKRYVSLTNVVAKDVKAQVEFNPKFVKNYRLLGYENRTLSHEDFKNDKVISEPYGAGGHGVALYELELGDATQHQELKYQQTVAVDSEELCTVKIRYKEPLGDASTEISKVVMAGEISEKADVKNAEFAYFLYCLSEKLRKSDKLDEADESFLKEAMERGAFREGVNEEALKLLMRRIRA